MKRYFSVWKYIEGSSLESKWDQLTMETRERIMDQLHQYTEQLRRVSNPFEGEFAVGTFCSTHELLNDPGIPGRSGSFCANNGPFKTVEKYKQKIPKLYDWNPVFDHNTKPVLDHMDWFMCNVLIDEEKKKVVGLLDWEKAGFIASPKENFLAGATPDVMERFYPWLTLFDCRAA
jgi:Phosphotransferase enzyme family